MILTQRTQNKSSAYTSISRSRGRGGTAAQALAKPGHPMQCDDNFVSLALPVCSWSVCHRLCQRVSAMCATGFVIVSPQGVPLALPVSFCAKPGAPTIVYVE